jgi:glutathione S-transferase
MITVFHAPRSRSIRVLWALEELGLPYELKEASWREPSREFIKANPSATIPAMVDGDQVITESAAIIMYLAEKYGPTPLAVRPDEQGFGDYCQFLLVGEAALAAPLNAVVGTMFMGPDDQKDNFTVKMIGEGYVRRLKLVERQLADHDYMAADRFTMADISVAFAIGMGGFVGLEDKIPARVSTWHKAVTDRPAYHRAAAR